MYSRRQNKVYLQYVRLQYKKTFELTALLMHFVRTFTVPMPYLFCRIYYSDE